MQPPAPPAGGPPPRIALLQMVTGHWVSKAIHTAAALGVPERLAAGPRPCDELAEATGADARSLRRLLRALACVGIAAEHEGDRFGLAPLGEMLVPGRPGSLHDLALVSGDEWYRVFAELLYSVQTGHPAWERVFGKPIFEYLADHPEAGQRFDRAMAGVSEGTDAAVAAAYDFSSIGTLVDVGGGRGTQLAAIVRANPSLRGVLFDVPPVIERAGGFAPDVAARLECVAGDFFAGVPAGADAYLLRGVLHDWDDADAVRILAACRAGLGGRGRVLVVEHVIQPGPSFGKLLDLMMLTIGGLERTEAEYRELFEAAGLELSRTVPTASPVSVIEGVPR